MRRLGRAGVALNRMWVRGRAEKGAQRRNSTAADKRRHMPRTVVIWTLGLGSADGAKTEKCVRRRGQWGLSPQPFPSDSETRNHTHLHPTNMRVCQHNSRLFVPSPSWSGLGQLIDAFSILSGGRWEDRQAARKSWWLLN